VLVGYQFPILIPSSTLPEVTLLIPLTSSDILQRVSIPISKSFDEAKVLLFGILGCKDVKKKLDLLYKLSTAAIKTPATNLGTDEDWAALLDDARDAEKKKKTVVPVKIGIDPLVHLFLFLCS